MNILIPILTTSITMSLIILLAMILFRLFPNTFSGKTRYIIWVVILIGLIIPFRPTIGQGFIQVDWLWQNIAVTETTANPNYATVNQAQTTTDTSEQAAMAEPSKQDTTSANAPSSTNTKSASSIDRLSLLIPALLAIWLIGAILSFSKHLLNYYHFRRMIKRWGQPVEDLATLELFDIIKESMGLKRKKIGLLTVGSIKTPMLIGFLHPTVLLPKKDLPDDELELIFEHELTHYKHKDLYVNLLSALAISLHWFNPIVYWCYPSIQGDGEVCCDEAVLFNRDIDYRRFYGEVIISMIERNHPSNVAFSTCFYSKKLDLKRRLMAIMENNNKTKKLSLLAVGVILSLILISGSIFAYNSARKKYIGENNAKNIALLDANLKTENVTFHKVRMTKDDGVAVYEVQFYSGNVEFDYEIDALTGVIREKDHDIEDFVIPAGNSSTSQAPSTNTPNNSANIITPERAKEIVLADAKLNAGQVQFIKTQLDYDDGLAVYDIDFISGNMEYDYEIDAVTGAIREKDHDIDYYVISNPNTPQPAPNTPSTQAQNQNAPSTPATPTQNQNQNGISLEKAKSIALNDAGLKANQVTFIKAYADYDDGYPIYDIEFYSGNVEYDYEIDAINGAIRERDRDVEGFVIPAPKQSAPSTPTSPAQNQSGISLEKAKSIALSHARVTGMQVYFEKAIKTFDDGHEIYDIEFRVGNTEFNYEISVANGTILEYDWDVED